MVQAPGNYLKDRIQTLQPTFHGVANPIALVGQVTGTQWAFFLVCFPRDPYI